MLKMATKVLSYSYLNYTIVKILFLVDSVLCGPKVGDFFNDDDEEKKSLNEKVPPKETLVGSLTNPLYLTMVSMFTR